MQQEVKSIKVRDLVAGFANTEEAGIRGYNGKLDIRPAYQREFVYDLEKQVAVINTIMKGC